MESAIKIENVFIKEEYMMSDTSDHADEEIASNKNSALKEEDLINFQQESYIKEEVIISDTTIITGNEASRNYNPHSLLEKNNTLSRNPKNSSQLSCVKRIKTSKTTEQNSDKASKSTTDETKVATEPKKFNTKDFAKLYCSKCDMTVEKVIWKDRECTKCGTITHMQCLNCDRRYLSHTSMYAHLKSKCGPMALFQCADCDYQVATKTRLLIHIERRHITVAPEDYHKCGNCGKGFKHRLSMQRHEEVCGKKPDLLCEHCPYKSKYVVYFKRHVQNHILHPKINAAAGNKDDASKSRTPTIRAKPMVKKEAARVQALVRAYCSQCKLKTRPTASRRKCDGCAMKLCYRCAECDKEYPAPWELREHIASKHLQDELKRRYRCSRCAKGFVTRTKLYRHEVYCGREADQRCDHCPFKSKYKCHLANHVRMRHLPVDRVEPAARETCVCQGCGKTYNGAESLGRHRRLYCGTEAKIACDHCAFKSRTKQEMLNHLHRMHLRIFTEEALKCKVCGKESTNLYIHATHVKNCGVK